MRRIDYTPEQDELLVRADKDQLKQYALLWGCKDYRTLEGRRTNLRRKVAKGLEVGPGPIARSVFARPAWFEENIDTLARGRKHG